MPLKTPTGPKLVRHASRHEIELMAEGLRLAAAEAGVDLPASYARLLASEELAQETGLRVTQLGAGVVIRTAPKAKDRLPVVVGYADARGQWHRDGHRHIEAPETKAPSGAAEVEL